MDVRRRKLYLSGTPFVSPLIGNTVREDDGNQ
jgi:hypothetical protein